MTQIVKFCENSEIMLFLFFLEHFAGQQPSESIIQAWLEKQGWTSNVPQASVILKQWKPVARLDLVISSSFVQNKILQQHWKGLTVRPVPDNTPTHTCHALHFNTHPRHCICIICVQSVNMYCLYVNCFCFFALSGARSQEFHSPRHLCYGDVTIKVI